MDMVTLNILEKGSACELRDDENKPGMVDDCEKLFYLAMAEGSKQPTQIQIHGEDGQVKQRIFLPEELHKEELNKRTALIDLVGDFLKDVIGLPEEAYGLYHTYLDINELYDHVLNILEAKGWGLLPEQAMMKYDRGDEIKIRENIVHLTADFLQYYSLATPVLVADFYGFPDHVTIDQFSENIKKMISVKNSEDMTVYVLDNPFITDDMRGELLPVFVEESGYLKIIAWVSPEIIPQNLVPIFDVDEKLVGWLDRGMEYPRDMDL